MQGGKGYSFTLDGIDRNVGIPTIFVDARVAVTPMGNSLRFGGTMEIAGLNTSVNMKRVKGIIDSIPRYYPSLKVPALKKEDVWAGLRPCSPDGLPYVGAMKTSPEVIIATGHAMMGLSLGAGTGKIVAALVDGQQIPVDLSLFRPERFK
jgi:D-amino-acid dehydrogenase